MHDFLSCLGQGDEADAGAAIPHRISRFRQHPSRTSYHSRSSRGVVGTRIALRIATAATAHEGKGSKRWPRGSYGVPWRARHATRYPSYVVHAATSVYVSTCKYGLRDGQSGTLIHSTPRTPGR